MSSSLAKADPTKQEQVGPTDMSPPSKGPAPIGHKVRIVIFPHATQAYLHSEDEKICMWCSINAVRKRMPSGNVGYFRADLDPGTGFLELGERLPDLGW